MGELLVERFCDRRFVAAELVARFPPQLQHPNKAIVFALASPSDAVHGGEIVYSRWRAARLPALTIVTTMRPRFELRESFFTYDEPPPGQVDWHLNFAHSDLFSFYGGRLFAQDEMQVAEHPALASLRHALLNAGEKPLTVECGVPTPTLVMGVERRCVVSTNPDPTQGRPHGLYGNAFAMATGDAVRRSINVLQPPTVSNILAIEAPSHGNGCYSKDDITYILTTAIAGFDAAREATRRYRSVGTKVVVHTGHWGCGAYGGNRVLMGLCQLVAAQFTGIDALVFHAGADGGPCGESLRLFDDVCPDRTEVNLSDLIATVESRHFRWGVGDGN